jgi:uncharacterized membrane protein YfcA
MPADTIDSLVIVGSTAGSVLAETGGPEFFAFLEIVVTILVGAGIGIVSGLFGVGGGFLIVPVLSALYGFRLAWIGTASCQALGQATTGLMARRLNWDHLQLPLIVSGGLLTGVWFGSRMLSVASVGSADEVNGISSESLVLGSYTALLSLVGILALWETHRTRNGRPFKRGWLANWPLPPYASFPQLDTSRTSIAVLAWFGLAVGFLAGLLGLSGGMIMLPGLIYCIGLGTHQAVAVTLVVVWLVAAQAAVIHAWYGRVELIPAMALLAGGTIGARIGTQLSERLGGSTLRNSFGYLLLGTAALSAAQLGGLIPH